MKNQSYTAFPCAIPAKKPGHATLALETAWADMYKQVSARMKKLRAVARVMTGEEEDKVAYALQRVFCDHRGHLLTNENGELLLDTLMASEIAAAIRPVMLYVRWQPFVRFPNAIAVVNSMFITTKEWELIRCIGFGGSDSAIAMGIHKYESSTDKGLYYAKTTLPLTGNDEDKAFIFQYGHEHEAQVVDRFCEKTGAKQLPCPFLFQHRKHKFMTANIDAIVMMPNGKLAVFEAKTTSSNAEKDWKVGPPAQYLRQPMQYMAVLDDDRIECAFIGCILANNKDSWYCHRIDRDMAMENELIRNEAAFFNHYIKPGIVPDLEGAKDKDLFAFFTYERPVDTLVNGKDVELSGNLLITLRNWQALVAAAKAKEAELNAINEQIAATALSIFETLGEDAKSGYLLDGDTGMMFTVGCRATNRTSIDKDALRLLSPEMYEKVAKTTTSVSAPSIKYKKAPVKKGA